MLHPLIQLAATRPQLLLDHAAAWADLLGAECGPAVAARVQRLLLLALAALLLAVALVLGGTAVMLWALVPAQPGLPPNAWTVLITTPSVALLAAVACAVAARLRGDGGAADRLLQQAQADWSLVCTPRANPLP